MVALDAFGPFDGGLGANFFEDRWRKMMRHMLGSASGVIRGFDNDFEVFADSSGMQVKVRSGQCFMRGHWGESTNQKTLSIAAAHASLPRRDAVVLRSDFLANVVEVVVLTGTPASSPVQPALTQNTSIWETYLAYVDVGAAVVTIAAGNIIDNRIFTMAHAKLRRSSSLSLPHNTLVKITPNVIVTRSGDIRQEGGDIELLRGGLWLLDAWAGFAQNATGPRQMRIADSGNDGLIHTLDSAQAVSGGQTFVNAASHVYLLAGSKVSMYMLQLSGGALDIVASATGGPTLTCTWVGP